MKRVKTLDQYFVRKQNLKVTHNVLDMRDVWQLICKVCDWPELYSLTKVCQKSRIASKRELNIKYFAQLCVYLNILMRGYIMTPSGRWRIYYEGIPGVLIIGSQPYRDYQSCLYILYKLFQGWSFRDVKMYVEKFESLQNGVLLFQRFCRISGAIKTSGTFIEWKK